MKTSLFQYKEGSWLPHPLNNGLHDHDIHLVLCFAGKKRTEEPDLYPALAKKFPASAVVLCSTAGEIFGETVTDDSVSVAALQFDKTRIHAEKITVTDYTNSYEAAKALAAKLPKKDLAYILVFSDGSLVNGSELVRAMNDATGNSILVTGGLAGDGSSFHSTLAGLNEHAIPGRIIAIGFYGSSITVTHGSQGGWDMFGPEREITRSAGNVLYEMDGKSALDLYKKYLGPEAGQLPGSALLFPLSVTMTGTANPVVRTILSIDEKNNSMTFAGDVPEGSKVRFMKANFDKLTSAASAAAHNTEIPEKINPAFSLLISCVGRKLILGQRIEEEVEAVAETFGHQTPLAGFYSYGEISPFNEGGACRLHNQTMTITSFYELS